MNDCESSPCLNNGTRTDRKGDSTAAARQDFHVKILEKRS